MSSGGIVYREHTHTTPRSSLIHSESWNDAKWKRFPLSSLALCYCAPYRLQQQQQQRARECICFKTIHRKEVANFALCAFSPCLVLHNVYNHWQGWRHCYGARLIVFMLIYPSCEMHARMQCTLTKVLGTWSDKVIAPAGMVLVMDGGCLRELILKLGFLWVRHFRDN